MQELRSRVAARVSALSSCANACLSSAFALLSHVEQVESKVRVLQLVSILVEAMGEQLQPHLGLISSALPPLWEAASAAASSKGGSGAVDAAAVVRLHAALISVLTHLIAKLRGAAMGNAGVASVVFPLLAYR
jgi:hypothetical protein